MFTLESESCSQTLDTLQLPALLVAGEARAEDRKWCEAGSARSSWRRAAAAARDRPRQPAHAITEGYLEVLAAAASAAGTDPLAEMVPKKALRSL